MEFLNRIGNKQSVNKPRWGGFGSVWLERQTLGPTVSPKPRSHRGVSARSCPTQCPGPSCCSKGSVQQQQHRLLLRFNLQDPGGQSRCSLGGQERSVCQWHNWLITTRGDGGEIYCKATPSVLDVAPTLLLPHTLSGHSSARKFPELLLLAKHQREIGRQKPSTGSSALLQVVQTPLFKNI